MCWDLFKADAHQYGAHACWVKQSVKRLGFLRRSFCCLWAAQQSGGFSWGSYLRISCREEVISLPTYRSTGRGQSHLQCRSREAGRRVGEKEEGWKGGGGGERERRALRYTHSLAPSFRSDDKQKIQCASLWHTRALPLKAKTTTSLWLNGPNPPPSQRVKLCLLFLHNSKKDSLPIRIRSMRSSTF